MSQTEMSPLRIGIVSLVIGAAVGDEFGFLSIFLLIAAILLFVWLERKFGNH